MAAQLPPLLVLIYTYYFTVCSNFCCSAPPEVTYRHLGSQWLSGRVLDSRPMGRGFEPHRRHCVVSLSKNINYSLVLVGPRKTRPCITERLLIGRKKSNQTKTKPTDTIHKNTIEPMPCNRYKLACAHIEDSDQPALPRSLIRVFDVRSMGRQRSNVS